MNIKMLNQAAAEALYSATYVENYLDCLENLPNDLQRQLSRLRELGIIHQGYMTQLNELKADYLDEIADANATRKRLAQMQQILIAMQEIGDEKREASQLIQDAIDNQGRLLEADRRNLDFGKDQENTEPNKETSTVTINSHQHVTFTVCDASSAAGNSSYIASTAANDSRPYSKRQRRSKVDIIEDTVMSVSVQQSPSTERSIETRAGAVSESNALNKSGNAGSSASNTSNSAANQRKNAKKKKRKSKQEKEQRQQRRSQQTQQDDSPQEMIDQDEPTYCLCDQISYGEMICCDNDLCPIEWFHFSCVSLSNKPKGKWFCPRCRGDRPNIMKPKAQFLKELEKYNKEKEEKA